MLSKANRDLGFFDIVIGGASSSISPAFLPVLAFLLVAFCVFAIGGCWVVMLITIPVFLPMAIQTGASVPLTIAAVMSGICFGYCLCFYSDTVFMCSAGTRVSSMTIIRTILPYALTAAILACAGFLVGGMVM